MPAPHPQDIAAEIESINASPTLADDPTSVTAAPTLPEYFACIARIKNLDGYLNANMQSSLTALLDILLIDSPDEAHPFLTRVCSPNTTDANLKEIAQTIDDGLRAFVSRPRSQPVEPVFDGSEFGQPQSSRFGTHLQIIRAACRNRDASTCRMTGERDEGDLTHIISVSANDTKAVTFWKFVSLIHRRELIGILKMSTFSPYGNNMDNMQNVLYLSPDAHRYFDDGKLVIIPMVARDQFPYNPHTTSEYLGTVGFPSGPDGISLSVYKYNDEEGTGYIEKELQPGDVLSFSTTNPRRMPLPHPLVFQLHAILAHMLLRKAAAGFPITAESNHDNAIPVVNPLNRTAELVVNTGRRQSRKRSPSPLTSDEPKRPALAKPAEGRVFTHSSRQWPQMTELSQPPSFGIFSDRFRPSGPGHRSGEQDPGRAVPTVPGGSGGLGPENDGPRSVPKDNRGRP